jgi:hypothetical protein
MADERRVTDGGRDLRVWLDRKGISVPRFCEENDLERIQVQRVLNGERWQRITVDFAHSIETATDGDVSWRSFLSDTALGATG